MFPHIAPLRLNKMSLAKPKHRKQYKAKGKIPFLSFGSPMAPPFPLFSYYVTLHPFLYTPNLSRTTHHLYPIVDENFFSFSSVTGKIEILKKFWHCLSYVFRLFCENAISRIIYVITMWKLCDAKLLVKMCVYYYGCREYLFSQRAALLVCGLSKSEWVWKEIGKRYRTFCETLNVIPFVV